MPLVSVIMNCYNSERFLKEAIDSVFAQTFKDWEIIFWDNRSTDKSAEIARSYGEMLKYYKGEEFLPLGAARRKAVEKAQGQYIALLDCDDIWLPDKLEKQIALFERNPSLGLVYSDCYIIDDKGNKDQKTSFGTNKPFKGDVLAELILYNPIPCPTAMFSRKAYNDSGGINPSRKFSEEYELFVKITQVYQIDYIDKPLAMYRIHEGNWSKHLWNESVDEYLDVIENALHSKPLTKKQEQRLRLHLRKYSLEILRGYVKRFKSYKDIIELFKQEKRIKHIINKLIRRTNY
jgi:glycosyltransferase involved in cell wall biosynthesis